MYYLNNYLDFNIYLFVVYDVRLKKSFYCGSSGNLL